MIIKTARATRGTRYKLEPQTFAHNDLVLNLAAPPAQVWNPQSPRRNKASNHRDEDRFGRHRKWLIENYPEVEWIFRDYDDFAPRDEAPPEQDRKRVIVNDVFGMYEVREWPGAIEQKIKSKKLLRMLDPELELSSDDEEPAPRRRSFQDVAGLDFHVEGNDNDHDDAGVDRLSRPYKMLEDHCAHVVQETTRNASMNGASRAAPTVSLFTPANTKSQKRYSVQDDQQSRPLSSGQQIWHNILAKAGKPLNTEWASLDTDVKQGASSVMTARKRSTTHNDIMEGPSRKRVKSGFTGAQEANKGQPARKRRSVLSIGVRQSAEAPTQGPDTVTMTMRDELLPAAPTTRRVLPSTRLNERVKQFYHQDHKAESLPSELQVILRDMDHAQEHLQTYRERYGKAWRSGSVTLARSLVYRLLADPSNRDLPQMYLIQRGRAEMKSKLLSLEATILQVLRSAGIRVDLSMLPGGAPMAGIHHNPENVHEVTFNHFTDREFLLLKRLITYQNTHSRYMGQVTGEDMNRYNACVEIAAMELQNLIMKRWIEVADQARVEVMQKGGRRWLPAEAHLDHKLVIDLLKCETWKVPRGWRPGQPGAKRVDKSLSLGNVMETPANAGAVHMGRLAMTTLSKSGPEEPLSTQCHSLTPEQAGKRGDANSNTIIPLLDHSGYAFQEYMPDLDGKAHPYAEITNLPSSQGNANNPLYSHISKPGLPQAILDQYNLLSHHNRPRQMPPSSYNSMNATLDYEPSRNFCQDLPQLWPHMPESDEGRTRSFTPHEMSSLLHGTQSSQAQHDPFTNSGLLDYSHFNFSMDPRPGVDSVQDPHAAWQYTGIDTVNQQMFSFDGMNGANFISQLNSSSLPQLPVLPSNASPPVVRSQPIGGVFGGLLHQEAPVVQDPMTPTPRRKREYPSSPLHTISMLNDQDNSILLQAINMKNNTPRKKSGLKPGSPMPRRKSNSQKIEVYEDESDWKPNQGVGDYHAVQI